MEAKFKVGDRKYKKRIGIKIELAKLPEFGNIVKFDKEDFYHIPGSNKYWLSASGRIVKLTVYGLVEQKANNLNKSIYTTVSVHKKTRTLHRLLAQLFIPNPNNLPQVNHKDGNKKNNHLSNLEWCSGSENLNHAYQTGLRDGPKTDLSRKEATAIKILLDSGVDSQLLSEAFFVPKHVIQDISCKKRKLFITFTG